jgi:carbon-monoxide dehydrogenase large subunit
MGNGIPRKEDPNLVTGKANWTDNIKLPGMLHLALLRSPLAHARVTHLDVSGALEQPGVVAAFTGEDLKEEWPGGVPCGAVIGEHQNTPFFPPIVTDEVRHVGDVVAVVVASDRYTASDALEFIEVDYEPLEVVVNMEDALKEDSPLVHQDLGTNECFTYTAGVGNVDELFDRTDDPGDAGAEIRGPEVQGQGDTDEAFRRANVVIKERYIQQRLLRPPSSPGPSSPTPTRGTGGSWCSRPPRCPTSPRSCSPWQPGYRRTRSGWLPPTWAAGSAPS